MSAINIPFSGFYESIWSHEIDRAQEMDAEHYAEKEREEQPAELQIGEDEFNEFFFRCSDYAAAYREIAIDYAETFSRIVSAEIGIELGAKFDGMDSPREYNFTTDRLYLDVPADAIAALFAASAADEHQTLAAMIEARHTSYDGFISFYRNDLAEWLEKPLTDWDHNELGTLLRAVMKINGLDDTRRDDDDLDMQIFYALDETFWQAWSNCVDWTKFDEMVSERRAELVDEKREIDPDYVAPYRCTQTLDLFQAHA